MADNIYFDAVKNIVSEVLVKKDYSLTSASEVSEGVFLAEFSGGNDRIAVKYEEKACKFSLLRAQGDEEYATKQVYLFDTAAGDGEAQAVSIGNDFAESLTEKSAQAATAGNLRQAPAAQRNKSKDSDETGAVFFVNRIPNVLPEVREPLLAHKEHYGQLLPNCFCEQCVNVALANLIRDNNRTKLDKLFDFLGGMYHSGDTDVKSIITMTILNSIENENNISFVESLLPDELAKAWAAARKFKGKKVAPEKDTMTQKMFKSMNDNVTNSLR